MVPEFVDRMRGSKWPSALPTGSADQSFPEFPENRRNWGLQSMVPNFVFCPAAASGCRLSLPQTAYAQTPFIWFARVCASQAFALLIGLLESFTSTCPSLFRPVSTMKWPV